MNQVELDELVKKVKEHEVDFPVSRRTIGDCYLDSAIKDIVSATIAVIGSPTVAYCGIHGDIDVRCGDQVEFQTEDMRSPRWGDVTSFCVDVTDMENQYVKALWVKYDGCNIKATLQEIIDVA